MELRSVGLKAADETCWITLLRRMNAISNDCSLNTSTTTTKTARISDWGREHPTAGFVPWLQVALFLATDSAGCIIVTIRLPDPGYFFIHHSINNTPVCVRVSAQENPRTAESNSRPSSRGGEKEPGHFRRG